MLSLRLKKILLLCFSISGMFLAFNLLAHYYHYQADFSSLLCSAGGGCDTVAKSSYATIAGIPLALWGYFYFSMIMILVVHSFFYQEKAQNFGLLLVFSALAFFIDMALLIIMKFIIKDFCLLCFLTYLFNLGILLLVFGVIFKEKKDSSWGLFFKEQIKKEWQEILKIKTATLVVAVLLLVFFTGGVTANSHFASLTSKNTATKITGSKLPPLSKEEQKELEITWQNFLSQYKKAQAVPQQYLNLEGSYHNMKGEMQAVLTLVEFSDFLCPYCKTAADYLQQVEEIFRGDIRVVHHHYPLDIDCNPAMQRQMHKGACLLARASICAGEQKAFWQMYHLIFQNQKLWSMGGVQKDQVLEMVNVLKTQHQLPLDEVVFRKCLSKEKTIKTLSEDIANANALDINSTPTIFFNGKNLEQPFVNAYLLQRLIEYEKQKK